MTILLWVQLAVNLLAMCAAVKFMDSTRAYISLYVFFIAKHFKDLDGQEKLNQGLEKAINSMIISFGYVAFTHVFNHRIVDIIRGFLG